MSTTIPSIAGTGRELVISPHKKLGDDAVTLRIDVPAGLGQRPVIVDRIELAAALAKEADFTIVDERELPKVNEWGLIEEPGRISGWAAESMKSLGWSREQVIAESRQHALRYIALLRWHEQKLAEETKEHEELAPIENFILENLGVRGSEIDSVTLGELARALRAAGFRAPEATDG